MSGCFPHRMTMRSLGWLCMITDVRTDGLRLPVDALHRAATRLVLVREVPRTFSRKGHHGENLRRARLAGR